MRREELFMDILGGLDEKYVSMAMPRSCGHSTVGDTGNVIEIKPVEVSPEVSRKDLRIYWITRTLGMAAAAVLIVGAAVLLIMNWDKIAVREPDRPGIVTPQSTTIDTEPVKSSESSVTLPPPLDYDSMTDEEKFAAKLLNGLRWKMNEQEVRLVAKEIWDRTEVRVQREDSNVLQEYYNVMIYDNVELYGEKANLNLVVFDNAGLKSLEYQVRYEVSDEGAENADKLYERIRADFVNALGEPNYPDLNWWDFADSKLHFDVYKADNWIVEIKIDDTSDPYEEITDTSMPEPYDDDPVRHIDFAAQWVSSFYTFEPMIPQEKRDMYYEWVQNPSGYTPYTITDNCNIISSVRKLELDWNDTKEILISSQVLSDDDISVIDNALTNSDESAFKHLIEKFRSPYAVIGDFNGNGYNVFSPLWLYYHTIGDYKAMRVPAKAVEDIIPIYASNLGLRDEAWAAFREKLYKYISGEKDNTAVTTSAVTENNGTTAVAVTCETTTSNVIGGTTVISDNDSSADTTAPAEEQPSDDELKALVEQGAEACGLKITVSDLTKASLKLNYYCEGDKSKYLAFMWGGKYEIQILSGNEWMTYDPDNFRRWNDEQMWFDSSFSINEFPDHSDEHETILFYGDNMYESEIPKGNYRVLKQIAVYGNGKNLGQLTAYAEFTIDEHTPNVFGITMTAKNVSPESVTLAVQQSGAGFHVKRNLGYEYPYYIQRKTSTGEWEKLDSNPVTWDPDIMPLNENGTTEITVKFAHEYGTLPNGTYRISQSFVNYVYSGNGELSVINRSTYFCEFEITDGEKNWGITLSINEGVTAEGLTLVISQRGGSYTGELEYGEPYSIERKNGDKWEPVKFLNDEVAWIDLAYDVESNSDKEEKLDWRWLYGTLPAGTYRIAKEFTDYRGPGDSDTQMYYAAFRITDDMVSKLGIALRATKYNARKMTLQIVQTGDTGYEKIGTNPYRYTIERKTDGIWQSYYAPQAGVPTPDLGLKVKNSGVTEYKLDWSEAAGSLPVGDYRLGMTFSCGDITETRYCEFTIEESMTNEFGISIEVLEVSKAGAKLDIKSKGADEQGFANYDGKFGLQKQTKNGNWKDLEVFGEPSWPQYAVSKIMMATTGYSGQMINIDWTSIFGKLENGHYRVSKTFHTGEGDSYNEITLYAEFDINADTPEQGLY